MNSITEFITDYYLELEGPLDEAAKAVFNRVYVAYKELQKVQLKTDYNEEIEKLALLLFEVNDIERIVKNLAGMLTVREKISSEEVRSITEVPVEDYVCIFTDIGWIRVVSNFAILGLPMLLECGLL